MRRLPLVSEGVASFAGSTTKEPPVVKINCDRSLAVTFRAGSRRFIIMARHALYERYKSTTASASVSGVILWIPQVKQYRTLAIREI
jgi:hypothetical protein